MVVTRLLLFSHERLRLVIFDIDGTLWDTRAAFYRQIAECFNRRGLDPPSFDLVMKSVHGGDLKQVVQLILISSGNNQSQLESIVAEIRRDYASQYMSRYATRIDGAVECVFQLLARGFLVALVSNGTREMVDQFMRHTGLEERLHLSLSSDDVIKAKPDPFPILYTLRYLGVIPGESLMVGDSPTDVVAGRRAGVTTIGVLSGVADRSGLEEFEPNYIIESVADLPAVLGF